MWREIGEAFRLIGSTGDGCRCALLLGNGKSFCAGIDTSDPDFGLIGGDDDDDEEGKSGGPAAADVARKFLSFRPKILEMQASLTALEECAVPVVAAIHGACIGAGIDLTCCADIRLSTPSAKFGVREARIGLAADVGTLQRFPKIVGHGSRVRELCFTSEDFDGIEAARIGFVSRIVQSEETLYSEAMDLCKKISKNSPVAVAGTKLSLNYSRDHSVRDGLEHVANHNSAALITDDLFASVMATSNGGDFANLLPHAKL